MEIIVRDSFVEYPTDRTRQWGAVVVARVDELKITGQFPPIPNTPGAETASEALKLAEQELIQKATALGVNAVSIVGVYAA